MWKRLILISLIAWAAFSWWSARPVPFVPGVAAPHPPQQAALYNAPSFVYKGYKITPLAAFSAKARVLSHENYLMGRETDLAKTDLTLGWGRMSDKTVLDQIDIDQANRFYHWHAKELPIPQREIETSSANMHMIPADSDVQSKLNNVRAGQIVHLRGYLVRVDSSDGWRWNSSLSREDIGGGACELVYVEELNSI